MICLREQSGLTNLSSSSPSPPSPFPQPFASFPPSARPHRSPSVSQPASPSSVGLLIVPCLLLLSPPPLGQGCPKNIAVSLGSGQEVVKAALFQWGTARGSGLHSHGGQGQIYSQSRRELGEVAPSPQSGPSNSERAKAGELANWTGPKRARGWRKIPVGGS